MLCVCVNPHVRVFWAFPSFPRLPPYPSSLKVPQRILGRILSQRLKMLVPFSTRQTGRLVSLAFYDTMPWTFPTRIYTNVVTGDGDKPNRNICIPLDSKSEKMIRLGFMLHNGVTFNQTGAAEPSARALISSAASSKEEREILRL